MAIQQISVFVENRAGQLIDIMKHLGEAAIDIRALSIAETESYGILRLIVSDTEKAASVLRASGHVVKINHVLAVVMPDQPGAMVEIASLLGAESINIEYLYAFVTPVMGSAIVVLRLGDNASAEELLSGHGFQMLSDSDFRNRKEAKA